MDQCQAKFHFKEVGYYRANFAGPMIKYGKILLPLLLT